MATGSNVSKAIVPITFLLTLGFVGAGAVMLVLTTQSARDDQSFLGATHEQSALAQSIAKDAAAAQAGEREAFNGLQRARDRMDNLVDQVASATSSGTAAQVSSQVSIVRDAWDATTPSIQTIFDSRDTIRVAHRAAQNLELSMPPLLNKVEEIQEALADGDSPRAQSYQVGLFATLARRAQRDIKVLLTGAGDMEAAAEQLDEAEGYMDRVLRGLASGDPGIDLPAVTDTATLALVREAQTLYQTVGEDLRAISSAAEILEEVDVARRQLGAQSAILAEEARILRQGYESAIGNRLIRPEYAYGALGLSLISLIALVVFWYLSADVRRAAEIQEEMQTKNQEAILRLLDELGSLADGDLTVQVTVTEDITGAIADSINYAIEALRELVVTINDTAIQVNSAAQQTRSITSHLAQASENQAKQITSATQQINTMATSIEQVSANAERSAKVAQQSVDIAHKGGEAVRRTITGMNTIRETIQETSKRIKRLGESSQEIGDIVELINDIAEQTNILALNASIQASMAGEAGRGFAVVADEVQRLAERAGNATRQIEALVKTIQSDTNEAVSSMERSTSDVVQGAQLAENAGRALDEIEKVSNHIATLVQSISNSARQQAGQAADVSRTMNVIQEITEQTAEGTQQTASSVGELVSLAAELRKSVAGFKLPGDGGQTREPQTAQAQAPEEESELPAEAQA